MNSCLVEFEDGTQVVTSRYAVRKVESETAATAAPTSGPIARAAGSMEFEDGKQVVTSRYAVRRIKSQ
ncbi:MAG: hypothetical protein AB7I57_26490 [Pirellulales bacterium]